MDRGRDARVVPPRRLRPLDPLAPRAAADPAGRGRLPARRRMGHRSVRRALARRELRRGCHARRAPSSSRRPCSASSTRSRATRDSSRCRPRSRRDHRARPHGRGPLRRPDAVRPGPAPARRRRVARPRVRCRRGRRAGHHRDAARPDQPVPPGRACSTTTRAQRTDASWASGSSARAPTSPRRAPVRRVATLLIAIPRAGRALVPRADRTAPRRRPRVKVLPSDRELFDGTVRLADIRAPHRRPTCSAATRSTPTSRRSPATSPASAVLVTGAGGSIGSELCRQICRVRPGRADHARPRRVGAARGAAVDRGPGPARRRRRLLVAGRHPRRRDRSREIFAEHRPEVVFHAAALKHLPLLETHPREAVQDERWGTLDLLDAARARRRRPLREHLHRQGRRPDQRARLHQAHRRAAHRRRRRLAPTGTYLSRAVRQRARQPRLGARPRSRPRSPPGGPITVTDPDVTRYFMTVEEAVQLVIQAGAIGRPGEALVLDMGEPVRIADVARRSRRADPARRRDRLHRPAPGREAPRGAVRRGRGRPPPDPPAHLAGRRAAARTQCARGRALVPLGRSRGRRPRHAGAGIRAVAAGTATPAAAVEAVADLDFDAAGATETGAAQGSPRKRAGLAGRG